MSLCINPACPKPYNPDKNLFCQTCGSELVLSRRYRVIELLSEKGGFANTYEVRDRDLSKVLKVLTNDHPHAIELFEQEAQVLSQLNHPGIPQGEGSFTYFPRDSQIPLHCLVMEKIEGVDLEDYQCQHHYQPIDQKLALAWLMQLANILHEVHSCHLFHRDIKPSNIILKPDGQLVLIDFGAVRQVTATILAGGQNTMLFTPGYAPPEQEKGYAVQQSDFFALGRTFVYLLTGKEPTDPEIYDHYNNELNWHKYAPHISPQLADFIDALIAEKATQRPADTTEILRQLADLENELYPRRTWLFLPSKPQKIKRLKTSVIPPLSPPLSYAGFWLRFQASILDSFIVMVLAASLSALIVLRLKQMGMVQPLGIAINLDNQTLMTFSSVWAISGTNILGYCAGILILLYYTLYHQLTNSEIFLQKQIIILIAFSVGFLCKWFYFVILESSFLKATLGKRLIGLRVVNYEGQRISIKQANQRYWGKLLSTLTLYIGFMLAGWTKKKQALHDLLAGTMIIKRG
jgi:serine/threonine protein kinase